MITTNHFLQPALFWDKETFTCKLCPHNCTLAEGQRGICRTRVNHNGTLCTLAWNNPCAINADPIEKKPLFHFMPGTQTLSIATAGCNMRCLNCQNNHISQYSPDEIPSYRLNPTDIINRAIDYNTPSISYTYTEPTVYYEFMLETAKLARSNGIKNIIVSNGYINTPPLKKLCKWIDAANIDLKCFDPVLHQKLTGAKLKPVLNTLKTLKDNGIWLEITHLVVPEYSDDTNTFRLMCDWLVKGGFSGTPLHINRFFPQHKLSHLDPTPIETIKEMCHIAEECGIKYIYPGNI